MGFSFGFTESDDEIEHNTGQVANQPIAPQNLALSSMTIEPHNLPKVHSLDSLLETLVDVKLTFDNYYTPVGENLVYRRDLFDVKHQVMTEDTDESVPLINSDNDLEKNIYEGGFKSWECSYDTVDKLAELMQKSKLDEYATFVELGCGTSLPVSYVVMKLFENRGARGHRGVKFVLSDFNYDVLRLVSLPNILIHWASTLPVEKLHELTTNEERPFHSNDELLCTRQLLDHFKSECAQQQFQFQFVSGSWGREFNSLVAAEINHAPTFVISSETIYSLDTLPIVAESIIEITRNLPRAYALVAAKNIYFGVGGSIIEFVTYLDRLQHNSTVEVEEIKDSKLKRSLVHIYH